MTDAHHFIHGRPVSLPDESSVKVLAPHTGRTIGRIPVGRDAAVDQAVGSAAEAFGGWKRFDITERIDRVAALRNRIGDGEEELVRTLVREVGKPVKSARLEVSNVLASFDYFLKEAERQLGANRTPDADAAALRIVRDPVGIVAAITPFNFPIQLLSWKLCQDSRRRLDRRRRDFDRFRALRPAPDRIQGGDHVVVWSPVHEPRVNIRSGDLGNRGTRSLRHPRRGRPVNVVGDRPGHGAPIDRDP